MARFSFCLLPVSPLLSARQHVRQDESERSLRQTVPNGSMGRWGHLTWAARGEARLLLPFLKRLPSHMQLTRSKQPTTLVVHSLTIEK